MHGLQAVAISTAQCVLSEVSTVMCSTNFEKKKKNIEMKLELEQEELQSKSNPIGELPPQGGL